MTVGHFGAPDRMSFTAMGDGVNLASRLEGLGKQYGVPMLVSATVERAARTTFWFRRLDRVAVKGRHTGVEIYELLGRRRADAPPPALIAPYEAALDAYFAADFTRALALFGNARRRPAERGPRGTLPRLPRRAAAGRLERRLRREREVGGESVKLRHRGQLAGVVLRAVVVGPPNDGAHRVPRLPTRGFDQRIGVPSMRRCR